MIKAKQLFGAPFTPLFGYKFNLGFSTWTETLGEAFTSSATDTGMAVSQVSGAPNHVLIGDTAFNEIGTISELSNAVFETIVVLPDVSSEEDAVAYGGIGLHGTNGAGSSGTKDPYVAFVKADESTGNITLEYGAAGNENSVIIPPTGAFKLRLHFLASVGGATFAAFLYVNGKLVASELGLVSSDFDFDVGSRVVLVAGTSATSNSVIFRSVTGTLVPANVHPASAVVENTVPTNYTPVSADVSGHLKGIDAKLGTLGGGTSDLQDVYDNTAPTTLYPGFDVKQMVANTNTVLFSSTLAPAFPVGSYLFATPQGSGNTNSITLHVSNGGTNIGAVLLDNMAGGEAVFVSQVQNTGHVTGAVKVIQSTPTSIMEPNSAYLVIQNTDNGVALKLSSIVGAFSKGEIVTGSPSSATGIVANINTAGDVITLSSVSGAFTVADTVSGGTSGATADVDVVANGASHVPLLKLNHLAGANGDAVDIQFTPRTSDPTNLVNGGLWFNTTNNQLKFTDGTSIYPVAHFDNGANRGSLNLPILTSEPSAPLNGDIWIVSNTVGGQVKFRNGSGTRSLVDYDADTYTPTNGDTLIWNTSQWVPSALPTAAPTDISDSTNTEGVATSYARSDHVHAHGIRGGGDLHAVATTSTAGFMSAADKTKLDGLTQYPTYSTLAINSVTTTTSTSYVPLFNDITPGAGTYLLFLDAEFSQDNNDSYIEYIVAVNSMLMGPVRRWKRGAAQGDIRTPGVISGQVVTVGAAEPVGILWRVSNGTGTCYNMNLALIKVG